MSDQPQTLFNDPPQLPQRAPGLFEQIVGVFTAPVELFQRLRQSPSFGWAMGVTILTAVVVTLAWGMKVDVEEMLRPILERNPNITAAQMDQAITVYKKVLVPMSIAGALFSSAAVLLLLGLFYWLIGKALHEDGAPSFEQSLSAAVVPGLVKLPHALLITLICLVRPIGGLTPEKIAPTSLGYFIKVESIKLHALLFAVEPFVLAEVVLSYLALRHLLRMKTGGALLCSLLPLLLGVGMRVLGAK